MAAGTVSAASPPGGAPLSVGTRLWTLSVVAPAGSATSFTILLAGITTNTKVVGVVATNAAARLIAIEGITPTAGTLTFNFSSVTLDGTETFDVSFITQ